MRALNNYSCEGQMSIFDLLSQDSWSGKTSPEPSVQTKERTSDVFLKKFAELRIKPPMYLFLGGGKWSTSGCVMGDWWSVAWRLHDAQFWGVPQRRKRIALVADFGGKSAPEILFERESMSGDIEQSEQARKETTRYTRESTYQSAYTLKIRGGAEIDSYGKKAGKGALVQTEKSGTLGVSQDQTLITIENKTQPQAVVYGLCSDGSNAMRSPNPYSGCYEADSSRTLDNNGGNPACNQGGMIIVDKEPMCIQRRFSSVNVSENGISPTLEAAAGEGGNNMHIVLEGNGTRESHKGPGYKESDVMYSLNTVEQHAVCTYQDKTGTLSPGAHAGSYNGQDAYNDMLVIGGGVQNQQQPVKPHFF